MQQLNVMEETVYNRNMCKKATYQVRGGNSWRGNLKKDWEFYRQVEEKEQPEPWQGITGTYVFFPPLEGGGRKINLP